MTANVGSAIAITVYKHRETSPMTTTGPSLSERAAAELQGVLYLICDSACMGRCKICPAHAARNAIAALDAQAAMVKELRQELENAKQQIEYLDEKLSLNKYDEQP